MKQTIQKQISKLHRKLDAITQQSRPLAQCEVCGNSAEVLHHYVQKSLSAYLRYHEKNLINLCNKCHASHHLSGNPHIVAIVVQKRGKAWEKWINDNRSNLVKRDKFYLEELKAKCS